MPELESWKRSNLRFFLDSGMALYSGGPEKALQVEQLIVLMEQPVVELARVRAMRWLIENG